MEHDRGLAQADPARRAPGTARRDPSCHNRLRRRKDTRLCRAVPVVAPIRGIAPPGPRRRNRERRDDERPGSIVGHRVRGMGRRQSRPGPFDMTAFKAFDLVGTPDLDGFLSWTEGLIPRGIVKRYR
jgi:hypothetical protein